jgi:iduronate 2-sulfatase
MRLLSNCVCAVLLTFVLNGWLAAAETAQHPNVLFIAIDDLNHWVGHLGRNQQVQTPNIDRLAARGVTFTRAYCAAPLCNPSRAALLSGLRPSTTGVYDNPMDWRKAIPENLTLASHFRKHGYFVAGAGKIYHGGFDRRSEWDDYFRGGGGTPAPRGDNGGVGGIKFAPLDRNDDELPDYRITSWIIEHLGEKRVQPFFLACGLQKPHMPWNVPRKYFDMYPLDKIELPPVKDDDLSDIPRAGLRMANPDGDHAAILTSGRWKEAVQAYLAAITYTDMNVGRLLDALDKSPHRDNTIVVLFGDHGWHLGEKHHWRKFSLWEEATRAPLIWSVPGVTKPRGVCDRTVDFMSIYPTLCDLCGLAVPEHVEGTTIRALLADPKAPWDRPALTTFRFQNHAVRNDRWRYIRYADGSEELYDESKDPMEWTNLAADSRYADIKVDLARWLPKENKQSLDADSGKGAKRAKRAAKG